MSPFLRLAASNCARLCANVIGSGIKSGVSRQAETEHHALIARAGQLELVVLAAFFHFERFIHTHGDIGRLLVDRHGNAAGVGVEAHVGFRVADLADGFAHDLGDVDVRLRADLARDVDLPGDREGFHRHAAERIRREDGVEHGVGDLVGDFIGVALGHRFRGEESAVGHGYVPSDQEAMYLTCSGVGTSILMFIAASLSLATSSSIDSGTGYTCFSSVL